MERGIAVRLTRRHLIASAAAVLLPWPVRAQGRDHAVLVTAEPGSFVSLTALELRKAYLGFTVVHEGAFLQPVRNRSDPLIDQVFLQHVVSMSADVYERRLLTLSLRQGRARPREVRTMLELLHILQTVPHSISYAWEQDVQNLPGIHIVRTLWRG